MEDGFIDSTFHSTSNHAAHTFADLPFLNSLVINRLRFAPTSVTSSGTGEMTGTRSHKSRRHNPYRLRRCLEATQDKLFGVLQHSNSDDSIAPQQIAFV